MGFKKIERLLEEQSIKRELLLRAARSRVPGGGLTIPEGELYDRTGPDVRKHIESFIRAYSLPLNELLVQDLDEYPVSPLQYQR